MFLPINNSKRSDFICYFDGRIYIIKFFYNLRRLSKYKLNSKKEIVFLDYYKWGGSEKETLNVNFNPNEAFRKMNSLVFNSFIEEVVVCYAFMPKNYGVVSENNYDTKKDGEDVQGVKVFVSPKGFIKYLHMNKFNNKPNKDQINQLKKIKKQISIQGI